MTLEQQAYMILRLARRFHVTPAALLDAVNLDPRFPDLESWLEMWEEKKRDREIVWSVGDVDENWVRDEFMK